MTPIQFRQEIRENRHPGDTAGYCDGFVQANLVIIRKSYAADFESFCNKNSVACPLIFSSEAGQYNLPEHIAKNSDIRTDLPKYRLYENGELILPELYNIKNIWQDDFVIFLIGCSFTFEAALLANGIAVSHISQGRNVPMFSSNIPCESVGVFRGNMVVSMRLFKEEEVQAVVEITKQYPKMHGEPVHIGDPAAIGINDISKPDFGDAIEINPSYVPVFWGCGVTPQLALMNAKLDIAITHSPGCMFVTDLLSKDYREV